MPESTPIFGIPYPVFGETITPVHFQNFANSIDTLLDTNQALIEGGLDRPYVQVLNNQISLTQAVDTLLTFNNVDVDGGIPSVDNDGMFDPLNPDRVTVQTAGVYMVTITDITVSGFTTLTSWRITLLHNSVIRYAERKNEASSSDAPEISLNGLIVCNVSDTLQARGLWTGTGGPATINSFTPYFAARFVCPLV